MKNLIKAIIISLLLFSFIYSASVDQNRAEAVAMSWYLNKSNKTDAAIEKTIVKEKENKPVLYIVTFSGGGFVIVAGDDVSEPILAYSVNSPINITTSFNEWLQSTENYINNFSASSKSSQAIENK